MKKVEVVAEREMLNNKVVEKYKTLPKKPPTEIVRIEGNLIEYPIATYSHKYREGNYVVYKGKNTTWKVGSPDGPLTGFNEFQLWALLMYAQKNDGELIAKNTLYQMLKDFSLYPHGKNVTNVHKGLGRLRLAGIITGGFYNALEKKYAPEETYSFFKYTHLPEKNDKDREFVFVFNELFVKNLMVKYCITTHWKTLLSLPTPICRKLFLYFTKKLGNKKEYTENWRVVTDKIGITDSNLTTKKQTLIKNLKIMEKEGKFDRHRFKGEKLAVYAGQEGNSPTSKKQKGESERAQEFNAKRHDRVVKLQGELIKIHINLNLIKEIAETHYIDFLEEILEKTKAAGPKYPGPYFLKLLKKYGRKNACG